MRLFKTDFSIKWIDLEFNGETYSIHFKDSFLKGVYDVSLWSKKGKQEVKVINVYPIFTKRLGCGWVLFKHTISKLLQLIRR